MENVKTIIKPSSGLDLRIGEIWQHRELLYFFVWRDIKVKYKQTFLGIAWAMIQPLGFMLIFVFLFSGSSLAGSSGKAGYSMFVLSGLVLWNLFNTAVSHASESMISNAAIIRKIYFPRLIIPLASTVAALLDFVFGLVLLAGFCIVFHHPVSWSASLFFPAALVVVLLTAFGLGTFLGAVNVKFRDFRYALPFLLQLLFFATQVIYPASLFTGVWGRILFAINPLNTAVALFRYPLDSEPVPMDVWLPGFTVAFLIAVGGLLYFRKTEAYFADIV